ncbi:MAG: MmgE/PrpD family protein [Rhodospirillales bacterium]|jgi:2-methylcitrate dehydratase PrpD
MAKTVAQELAARINGLRYEDYPQEAIDWAKIAVLDTLGVSLAGAPEETTQIPMKVLGAAQHAGPSLVWGSGTRTSPLDAALINGVAAHALDYDDCHDTMGGHPSAAVIPSCLALSDDVTLTGRDFIEAFIAGYEMETRLASGVHFEHYIKGWHPTATMGTFGAAAACGRLLKLDENTLATALALCCSMAAGVKANFGTMTKPLHVGLLSRNGLFAALMAKEGFTASMEAFEHKQGFFMVYNGEGTYDIDKVLSNWGNPLQILEPGVAIKQFPSCGGTHSAADAVIKLKNDHNLAANNIEKIESKTHEWRFKHTNRPDPKSDLDAKFSVQYVMSRAMTDGVLKLDHFENGTFAEPEVQQVLKRIESSYHNDDDDRYSAYVTITTKDGRKLEEYFSRARGRGPAVALSADELKTKFVNCASRALTAERVEQLYTACQTLETLNDMRDLTSLMETAAANVQAAE